MGRSPADGFSLIELLIVLAIVAILATVTVPSFTGFVAKARRSDAMAALLQVQLAQERWRAEHLSYTAELSALGQPSSGSPDGCYRLRVQVDGNGFVVTAEPVGVQQADRCGTFAIDESGPHYADGFADRSCWRR